MSKSIFMVSPSTPITVAAPAIRLVNCDHDELCHGYRWEIVDEDHLARLVAWTMQGHYQHAEKVLNQIVGNLPPQGETIKAQAIERLTLPPATQRTATARHHRDGLVFQHIAWIAAIIHGGGRVAALMPHLRPADKGFDCLLVPLNDRRQALSGMFICEEKATENPRNLITSDVWPSILEHEAGRRDAELNGCLLSILKEHGVANLDQICRDIHWLRTKAYRVSLTLSPEHHDDAKRKAIFKDYDDKAKGSRERRRAETLTLQDIRDWMDQFCQRVTLRIRSGH